MPLHFSRALDGCGRHDAPAARSQPGQRWRCQPVLSPACRIRERDPALIGRFAASSCASWPSWRPLLALGLVGFSTFCSISVIEPPAFSTAAWPTPRRDRRSAPAWPSARPCPAAARRRSARAHDARRHQRRNVDRLAGVELAGSIAAWSAPRLTSLKSRRIGLLKPRLGRRRCSGIWPPSKPRWRTPERAVWPLPPRPPSCPCPSRCRGRRACAPCGMPGLSLISLSFMGRSLRPRSTASSLSSTTRTRWLTLRIMPRTAGVSGASRGG